MRQSLTHLRRNAVAYLALVLAIGTGTAYAAAAIPDGSVTAAKLHKNSVTSNKVKNGSLKPKDLKKPTYVQSTNLQLGTPPAVADVASLAPYDFTLPTKGRTSVTVFIPTISGELRQRQHRPADHRPLHRQRADRRHRGQRPGAAERPFGAAHGHARAGGGAHTGRVGITCTGASQPNNLTFPGAKSWTIIQAD